jgi:hypothetical protein
MDAKASCADPARTVLVLPQLALGFAPLRPNAVKLRSGPVEDIDLWRGVVFDDLVVGVFDVGVADGDSADDSRTGSEAAFR